MFFKNPVEIVNKFKQVSGLSILPWSNSLIINAQNHLAFNMQSVHCFP